MRPFAYTAYWGLGVSLVLCVDVVGAGESCGLSFGLAKRASFVSVAIFTFLWF